ncbi:methionyl-tRNA formyltransferase [Blattabacterium cuenoti]|uniref:methionyl-tRNA formyltransferase n=1 Tax=Blattabacterium cuenoti TaxID=1653831 RepID=UPI00163B9A99|nr:methionyl-tRNA formyltransferase [Blattabacterium cuenoti]
MNKFPKIVFFGSNHFSIYSINELYNEKYNIVGIITTPDNEIFHGDQSFSPVKKYAIQYSIPFMQPKNLHSSLFLKNLKAWNPDLQIVVSFRILPKKIWNLPKMGTINLHASFLPQYRGPSPINWAIINGEKYTGISVFFIEKKIDHGKIIIQKKINIEKEDTAGDLENKMKKISGKILHESIQSILNDNIKTIDQKTKNIYFLKYAPKISSIECRIQWKHSSIESIYNKIRGLSPYPTAWTILCLNKEKYVRFKIFIVKKIYSVHSFQIGKVILKDCKMMISVKNGFISIIEGQIEGRKRMYVKDIFNGILHLKKNIFVE